MLANWQQQNENPESFLYLYLDMDLSLDLIIFNLLMFYHLQSMFTYVISKAILYDWLGHSSSRVARVMGGGFGAKPGAKPCLASPCYSLFQLRDVAT